MGLFLFVVDSKILYDAFGNILQKTGPTVPGGLTYTGRQYHSRSGLYYYRARWYSPQLGRFLTQDPIGHLGGVNLYAYVGNSPVVFIDPLGLQGGPMFDLTGGYTQKYGKMPPYQDAARTMERGLLEHGNEFTLVVGGGSLVVGGFAIVPAAIAGITATGAGTFTATSALLAGGVGMGTVAAGLSKNPPPAGDVLSQAIPTALGVPWSELGDFLRSGFPNEAATNVRSCEEAK